MRAVAVAPDGQSAISGSFDTSAIRWSLSRNAAEQVLRFHESAVNAVATLKDGRVVTGGEDGKIAIWKPGVPVPERTFEGHTAPVVALAVSPDGSTIASASWDRTIRLWSVTGGAARKVDAANSDWNPNGSSRAIAGIVNRAGNVMALMPHPERCSEAILGNEDGVGVLRSVAEAAVGANRRAGVTR